jgi:hypothetical protein
MSSEIPLCDPYVWEDPRYLFRTFWKQPDRSRGVCASELTNHVILSYLIAIILGYTISALTKISGNVIILVILATIYLIPTFKKMHVVEEFRNQTVKGSSSPVTLKETFVEKPQGQFNAVGAVGAPPNPFNNVLVNEIMYAPTRKEAPDITTHEAKLAMDDFFRVQWYSDPTDVFGKSQSQRQFITQPSTSIPNDQQSYQEWLYKIPGKTCKEGNTDACYGGTDGGVVPWLNI